MSGQIHWSWALGGWEDGPPQPETIACPTCGQDRHLTRPPDRRHPHPRRICPQCNGGRG